MIAGHLTTKNGYWYLILQIRDDHGQPKSKWIATHMKVNGNKRKAEAMLLEARLRELIPTNPADSIPRPRKGQFVANCYTPEECKLLLTAIKGDPLELPILLSVLYGLQRSEELGLKWGAIDFERNTITISHSVVTASVDGHCQTVYQDKLKRKSSFRSLPLTPMIVDILRETAERTDHYTTTFSRR